MKNLLEFGQILHKFAHIRDEFTQIWNFFLRCQHFYTYKLFSQKVLKFYSEFQKVLIFCIFTSISKKNPFVSKLAPNQYPNLNFEILWANLKKILQIYPNLDKLEGLYKISSKSAQVCSNYFNIEGLDKFAWTWRQFGQIYFKFAQISIFFSNFIKNIQFELKI